MNFSKSIRKFRKEAKAISPVIATLLMIAIAVVASLVTYAWVMGYMNFQTEKTGKAIQIQSVTYDGNVSLTDEDDKFTIYVQNVGDSDVTLTSVYINGALATAAYAPAASGDLPATDTATITANTNVSGNSGQLADGVQQVTIKVVTADGTFSEVTKQFTIQ